MPHAMILAKVMKLTELRTLKKKEKNERIKYK